MSKTSFLFVLLLAVLPRLSFSFGVVAIGGNRNKHWKQQSGWAQHAEQGDDNTSNSMVEKSLSSSSGEKSGDGNAIVSPPPPPPTTTTTTTTTPWIDRVDAGFLKEIEEELVQRYKQQGYSDEEAQREASVFMSDKEQAEKYLEMRMYSAAQAEEIGLGLVAQLLGGFLVGFSIIAGPKLLQAYHHQAGGAPSIVDVFPTV